MKKIKKQMCLTWAIALILLITNFNLYSYVCLNGGGRGYVTPGGESLTSSNMIETYIINGADSYLAAKLDIEAFLRLIEMKDVQGLEYKELNAVVDSSISNMKKAIGAYEALIREAENTPYNEDLQTKLKSFDYAGFMYLYRLNPFVFEDAAVCLKNGDITGVFKKNHARLVHILELLQAITGQTTLSQLPGLPLIWQLNESCCEASMFGSYVARVFFAIH